mgnify:CR=1 FL=1
MKKPWILITVVFLMITVSSIYLVFFNLRYKNFDKRLEELIKDVSVVEVYNQSGFSFYDFKLATSYRQGHVNDDAVCRIGFQNVGSALAGFVKTDIGTIYLVVAPDHKGCSIQHHKEVLLPDLDELSDVLQEFAEEYNLDVFDTEIDNNYLRYQLQLQVLDFTEKIDETTFNAVSIYVISIGHNIEKDSEYFLIFGENNSYAILEYSNELDYNEYSILKEFVID